MYLEKLAGIWNMIVHSCSVEMMFHKRAMDGFTYSNLQACRISMVYFLIQLPSCMINAANSTGTGVLEKTCQWLTISIGLRGEVEGWNRSNEGYHLSASLTTPWTAFEIYFLNRSLWFLFTKGSLVNNFFLGASCITLFAVCWTCFDRLFRELFPVFISSFCSVSVEHIFLARQANRHINFAPITLIGLCERQHVVIPKLDLCSFLWVRVFALLILARRLLDPHTYQPCYGSVNTYRSLSNLPRNSLPATNRVVTYRYAIYVTMQAGLSYLVWAALSESAPWIYIFILLNRTGSNLSQLL